MNEGARRSISSPLSLVIFLWREPLADQIPVPGITPDARSWILQRLELKPGFWQTYRASVLNQALSVRRHEMGHLVPLPHVTVEPQPTIHRVDHPITTLRELDVVCGGWQSIHSRHVRCRYWQTTTPSVVAGGSGALPA